MTKVISISEKAYEALKNLRNPENHFQTYF
jgi:predicted CopG family antitoxin